LAGGVHARPSTVLLVGDHHRLSKHAGAAWADEALRIVAVEPGPAALARAETQAPDLVVVDDGSQDPETLRFVGRLRETVPAPILVLSVPDPGEDIEGGLDAGAGVAVVTPGTADLLARVRAWLCQIQQVTRDLLGFALEVGELRIDFSKRSAFVAGRRVQLSPLQYQFFATFVRNAGRVLTHEQLLTSACGTGYSNEVEYLRVHVGLLRQKFEPDPSHPRYFVTVAGIGYRLALPVAGRTKEFPERR
jgi:two-component system KDP operon response regulator KdpE